VDELTQLLQAGYQGNLTTPRPLQSLARLSVDDAAALCGVSRETYRRWGQDRPPNRAALRLLAVRAGYMPWPGWDGWEVHNGYLFPPGFTKGGFAPGDVLVLPFLYQLISEYRRQLGQQDAWAEEMRGRTKVASGGGVL